MHERYLRNTDVTHRLFRYLVNRDKMRFSRLRKVLESRLLEEKTFIEKLMNVSPVGWFFDFFYFKQRATVFKSDVYDSECYMPDYFFRSRKTVLKIPNVLDNAVIGCFYVYYAYFIAIIFQFSILLIFEFLYSSMYVDPDSAFLIQFLLPFTILFSVIQIVNIIVRSQHINVPYLIFDSAKKTMVICGTGSDDERVPFKDISFNLLQIEESLDHCAIEMRIERLGLSPTLMVTDICMSQVQAKGVLKTYYAILDGTLSEQPIKKYRPLLRDFNVNLLDGLFHLNNMTFSWFKTVLPHGFGFYCVHGPAMGVLKRYIRNRAL